MDKTRAISSRKVAVVVALDVVGYSKLIEKAEESTIRRLTHYWESHLRSRVESDGGRLIKLMGDGALLEFPSVGSALDTTAGFVRRLIEEESAVPPDLQIRIRAGLHVGDVVVEADDVYGHGVNIAARLEGIAAANSVCLSDTARSALGRRAPKGLVDIGYRRVKNIEEPVRVWTYDFSGSPGRRPAVRIGRRLAYGLTALVAAALLVGVVVWQAMGPPVVSVADRGAGTASIVVLPFRNLSDDRRQDYFVDGMTEDLILDLARLDNLFVVSRNTAFAYRDRNLSERAIADELDVRYIMQGSVRRQEERIRVNVAIVDGGDGTQLWGQRYDEEIDDVFDVQDRLKRQIVDALALQLGEGEEAELTKRRTDNIEAYELYLRGRAARQQGDPRSFRLAYWAFEKAIALEPDFAPAHAALAELYATDFGGIEHPMEWERPPTVSRAAAEGYAKRARALAPESALPDIALARLRIFERELGEALAHADRAVALEPQLAESWVVKARVETALGRHEQALETIAEAFRLDPEGTATQYAVRAMAEFGMGDYAASLASSLTASEAAKVRLNWQFLLIGIASTALHDPTASTEDLEEKSLVFRTWGLFGRFAGSPEEYGIAPIFVAPDDQERLMQGIARAGVFGAPIATSRRFPAKAIRELLFGQQSTGFCPANEFATTLRISPEGQALWGLRYDLSLAGTAEIVDDRLCMSYPALSHLGDLCFTVFKNDPPAVYSKGHEYSMVGPLLCHFTPGKN